MLNIFHYRNKFTNQEDQTLLIKYMLKILKKKNKNFHSYFTLTLPSNGSIPDKEFVRVSKKFVRKIQRKQLYFALFQINDANQQLQVNICISEKYSSTQIKSLQHLWEKILLKENSLLILKDVQNCSYYRPINTTFEFFQDFFSFKKLKLQVIDRLGKTNKKKFFSRYLIECDPFYASNVFGQIIKILRVLILREDSDEIEKRLTLKMENRIRREKQQKGDR